MPYVNSTTDKFAYQRVRSTIEEMLLHGELTIGDRLPPIRQLAERFHCNYHTVRKGLDALIREELLESRTGSGVFVRGGSRTISPAAAPGSETVLAVVCHPPVQPTDAQFIASLHEEAEKRHLNLELHTVSSFSQPQRIFDRIAVRGCMAILLPLLRSDDHIDEIAGCLGNYSMPFVVGTPFPGLEDCCYETSDIFGISTQLAVKASFRYFRELGFEHIALLLPAEAAVRTNIPYLESYTQMCVDYLTPPLLQVVDRLPGAADSIFNALQPFRGNLGIICYDDELAIRLSKAAMRRGWSIPEDIALIGLGNIPEGAEMDPPLTSVIFPYDYVAAGIIECAQALAAGRSAQRTTPIWQPIILRESCGGVARLGRKKAQQLLDSIKEDLLNTQPERNGE